MSARVSTAAAVLLGTALLAWIVTFQRMAGMDAGPATDLGGLGWYVGVWVTMMAAMMLPSVTQMVLLFARVGRAPTWIFLAGYLAAWTAYGLLAYGVFQTIRSLRLDFLAWHRAGPYLAGAAVAAAGLYQLLPLKDACLRHCRTPLHFVVHGWRDGRLGALRMGAEHGLYCVGCCFGLMVVLFALGVMSLFWIAVIAAVIFAEKVTPLGARLRRPLAVALALLGVWVAAAPSSVPGLTQPDRAPAMARTAP